LSIELIKIILFFLFCVLRFFKPSSRIPVDFVFGFFKGRTVGSIGMELFYSMKTRHTLKEKRQ